MRGPRLTIDTSYGQAPSDGGFVRVMPSVYMRQEDAFLDRLTAIKEAFHNDTVIAETDTPLLSRPFARMLERIVRGLDSQIFGTAWYGMREGETGRRLTDFSIGAWDAKVLIVGYAFSQRRPSADPELPFVSVNPAGSAYRFTKDLELAGVQEKDLLWVNATDRTGAPHDGSALAREPWRLVIGLGWRASEWAESQGLQNVVSVPPPAWWYREQRVGVYRAVQIAQAACLR